MDETLFEALVGAHYEGLFRFALSLVRRGEAAADLTQETFYRFATKGSQLRDPSKAKSWLYTTLYRQFLMGRRRETRFPHVELTETQADLPVVEPDLVSRLDSAVVVEAMGDLDDSYRIPLTLFYLGDHSYREIAEILDVPIGTVMSRLSRGKTLLRTRLGRTLKDGVEKIIPLPQPNASQGSTS